MYRGTLINDLMNAAERVAKQAEAQITEELHAIVTMQIAINEGDKVYQGAA